MRQAIIIISLIGSFTVFATTVHLLENSIMFLLFGIMPGRSDAVPASIMLTGYSVAAILVSSFIVLRNLTRLTAFLRATLPLVRNGINSTAHQVLAGLTRPTAEAPQA